MARQEIPGQLELVRGDAVLGTIDVKPGSADLPWYSGAFHPSARFAEVRALFDNELQLIRANTSDDPAQWDAWEAVNARLHEPGLRLQAPDLSYVLDDILIHIDGSEAWWRSEAGLEN
jgi:hypothetical protein